LAALTTTALLFPATVSSAGADSGCVRVEDACFTSVAAALGAADDGGTVRLPAGTFSGGITVTKSITLAGAGADQTVLKGGGPVLTIGKFGDSAPPTVTVRDLTVTGGRTTSGVFSQVLAGQEGVWATGGGISVPLSSIDFDTGEIGRGATVRLVRTVVEGNGAAPVRTVDSGLPCPGASQCPFALASGGGIDTSGDLTLDHSVVRDNHIGTASGISALASDSEGGGIRSWVGSLTIRHSRIESNSATGTAPNARFAEGGGIFHGGGFLPSGGRFTMRHSTVTGNIATLASGLPDQVDGVGLDQVAIGGGLQLTEQVPATLIDHSIVSDNQVRATNTVGSSIGFAGGALTNLPTDTRIMHSTFLHNRVSAQTLGNSTGLAHADTGGLQLHGTMRHSTVRDNRVTAAAADGNAETFAGAVYVLRGRGVRAVEVRGNTLTATAPRGTATVLGGGLLVDEAPEEPGQGGLEMSDSRVRGNRGTAVGQETVARGGGIFDAPVSSSGPFGGALTLTRVRVGKNRLSPEITAMGGGLFVQDQPLALRQTRIRGNDPDECVGCATATTQRAARQETSQPNGLLRTRGRSHADVHGGLTLLPRH